MRSFIALAGAVCLLATGCAGSGMLANRDCTPCHVARSQTAARPTIYRDGCRPCCALFGKKDNCCETDCGCDVGCGCDCCPMDCCCEPGCSCESGQCCGGCNGDCCNSCGGNQRSCRKRGRLLEGKAMCTVCGIASGFCPHRGGYPEQTTFNPGPPTGQVAYPYYTVRGPRDFLMCNPASIGPY